MVIARNEVYDGGEDAAGIFLHRSSDGASVHGKASLLAAGTRNRPNQFEIDIWNAPQEDRTGPDRTAL